MIAQQVESDFFGIVDGYVDLNLALRVDSNAGSIARSGSGFVGDRTAITDFSHTAKISQVLGFDASGNPVNLTSAIGGDGTSFSVAAAVPEPSSWAIMIAGAGLIGGTLRRKHGARQRAIAA